MIACNGPGWFDDSTAGRAAASLAQATLQEKAAEAEAARRLRSVRTALTKLEKLLYEEKYM
ncbi:MAG: hypothetical protein FJ014_10380 [Chloroflexi bacterium]|nr:hypothetical protein [Chloroflexota bacterium]